MASKRIHVTPAGDGWGFKHEGDDSFIATAETQAEAERAAKSHAKEHGDYEVVLHGQDGRIRDSDTMDRDHESAAPDTVR
jgi:hypothetical protein